MPTCAMQWHGRATWMSSVCVCVCVHVRVCLDLLFPDGDCVPACDCLCESAGELSLVRVRVNSSYGQMPPPLLSRQQAATKRDRKRCRLCQGYSIPGSVKIATLMLSWWKKSTVQYVYVWMKTSGALSSKSARRWFKDFFKLNKKVLLIK